MFKKFIFAAMAAVAATAVLGVGSAAAGPGPSALGGGSGIIIADQYECTLTTIGNAGGRLVGLTAGHCGHPGDTVKAEYNPDGGVVGTFAYTNPDLDYAIINFNPGKVVPINRVGNVTITGVGNPAQFGNIVCKEGRTTGNTCGLVYGDVFGTSQETWTQTCVIEGDSGSPVVIGSTLVGMVNAYLFTPCIGPEVGTNIDAILRDMGGHGLGGYRPI